MTINIYFAADAISSAKPTADAFVARIKAEALEKAAKKCGMIADANPYRYGQGADACEDALKEAAADLRKGKE